MFEFIIREYMKISGLLFISIRYIYTGGGGYISSTMSIISIVGTCLSVAILICILSIMNGFEDEQGDYIEENYVHVVLKGGQWRYAK